MVMAYGDHDAVSGSKSRRTRVFPPLGGMFNLPVTNHKRSLAPRSLLLTFTMGPTRRSSRLAGIKHPSQPTKNFLPDSNPCNDASEDLRDECCNDTSAAFTNGNAPKRRAKSGASTPTHTKKKVRLHSMITTNTDLPKSEDTTSAICVVLRWTAEMGDVECAHVIPQATSAKTASHHLLI